MDEGTAAREPAPRRVRERFCCLLCSASKNAAESSSMFFFFKLPHSTSSPLATAGEKGCSYLCRLCSRVQAGCYLEMPLSRRLLAVPAAVPPATPAEASRDSRHPMREQFSLTIEQLGEVSSSSPVLTPTMYSICPQSAGAGETGRW